MCKGCRLPMGMVGVWTMGTAGVVRAVRRQRLLHRVRSCSLRGRTALPLLRLSRPRRLKRQSPMPTPRRRRPLRQRRATCRVAPRVPRRRRPVHRPEVRQAVRRPPVSYSIHSRPFTQICRLIHCRRRQVPLSLSFPFVFQHRYRLHLRYQRVPFIVLFSRSFDLAFPSNFNLDIARSSQRGRCQRPSDLRQCRGGWNRKGRMVVFGWCAGPGGRGCSLNQERCAMTCGVDLTQDS